MPGGDVFAAHAIVAPVRERGLKFVVAELYAAAKGRSREGAWIEIAVGVSSPITSRGRSREGAWIEILLYRQGLRHGKSLP